MCANRVFVVDGPVWSSAGITAGIDLALHCIGDVCGDAVAAALFARRVQTEFPNSEQAQNMRNGVNR